MPDFQTAFPDFPPATMPAIPAGFMDRSWRNDSCPCFVADGADLILWVDYADDALREWPGGQRFALARLQDGQLPLDVGARLVETDDWQDILDELAIARAGTAVVA